MNPKKRSIRIIALTLSAFVLFGTFGINLDLHLCQGKIKTFSFFGEAQKCVEMEESTICEVPNANELVQKQKCCSDAQVYSQASFQSDVFLHLQVASFNAELAIHPLQNPAWINFGESDTSLYPPPNDCGKQSILILHQTFLI
jgi:hypothetical protein